MKRLRVKKMAYKKIIKPVAPTTNMFRVRNQFSFIEFALNARNKAQAQTEEAEERNKIEQARVLTNSILI